MESLIGKVEKTRVKGTKPASNSSIKEWLGHLSPFNVKKVNYEFEIFNGYCFTVEQESLNQRPNH